MNLSKIINQIIPRLIQEKIELEFYHLKIKSNGIKNYLIYVNSILEIMLNSSNNRISLALSPLIFSTNFIDNALNQVYSKKKIPIIPLTGVDDELFIEAKEIGLERNIKKLEKMININSNEIPNYSKTEVESAIRTKQEILLKLGPNNVHDILDSLNENH
jgi:hypothetical protein